MRFLADRAEGHGRRHEPPDDGFDWFNFVKRTDEVFLNLKRPAQRAQIRAYIVDLLRILPVDREFVFAHRLL